MRILLAVLGLSLLGALHDAFPQARSPAELCPGDPSRYYDEAAGKCCYRCSEGWSSEQQCPDGPSGCRKQCDDNYYLNRDGRCVACVSCSRDDLVEKKPCTWNSSRVCECRPGMYCFTSAKGSCARCSPHSTCPPGTVVKFPGTAENDTVCAKPSPSTSSKCSASPETCRASPSSTGPATPSLIPPAASGASTRLRGGRTSKNKPADALRMTPASPSAEGNPGPDSGLSPQQPCPPGAPNCTKQCGSDYYLDRRGLCMACVSCNGGDLVEKKPCTWNSSRVCECRPGLFCAVQVKHSCARCVTSPICPPGTVAKLQGDMGRDTTSEPPPSGPHSDCTASPEDQTPPSTNRILVLPVDSQTTKGHEMTSTETPFLFPGQVLSWVLLLLLLALGASTFLLCHQRACRKWVQQKLHLCYPRQTFRPKPEPVDSRTGKEQTDLKRSLSVAELCRAELGLTRSPLLETPPAGPVDCPESQRLLEASPCGSPPSPTDLPEPRVAAEPTNNRIENIYIMKAETVIVGTVKSEVPEARGLAGPASPAEPEFEDLEVDHAPHYPEQETEPPLGGCRDVMFSVEEEGKADPAPTAASEK